MKLNDLNSKKNIYKVPEGYFDDLPGRIQKRIEAGKIKSSYFVWDFSLVTKIVAPVLAVVLLIFIVVLQKPQGIDAPLTYAELLDQVEVDEMIAYLEMTDITSEEILEEVDVEKFNENFDDLNEDTFFEEEIDDATLDALIEMYEIDLDDI